MQTFHKKSASIFFKCVPQEKEAYINEAQKKGFPSLSEFINTTMRKFYKKTETRGLNESTRSNQESN